MAAKIDYKIRWGMAIDLDKCTGCGACTVSCQVENNNAPNVDGTDKLRIVNWLSIYRLENGKSFPDADVAYLPLPCMQCGNPSCVPVCPVIATEKGEEGAIVSQISPRCIGCRYCMAACPYHVRTFNWFDPVWPKGMEKTLTPFTSTRPRGVVEKCHFCHHRWTFAKEKARVDGMDPYKLPEDAYIPACVEMCPSGAMVFGDLKNPEHKVYELARSPHARRLLEKLGGEPQVYYISRREWVRNLMDNHLPGETGHGKAEGGNHG
ncbi:4Fe-4S ferredoxin, iron-sulpur binding domain-containing protein [Alkalidesulfovibrio alkalitolerans DSM 16529]|uniref:4Fe-4S ferredoxin, iron-sulpur binding domain-containing protein n=1 Tax=Alkalidesulfovibrio alkalitolerans DSM 16529 TaxID=1121439 RepID=S7T392_9BACT|nr:menaquinone reductase iron-sulfur cluster-binding subunit QrcC [Alkalidesulfovibrio alkalitolerans]EPR30970.1 4Fe-4S ferredoxin, iron-sulpur binding domain-containing protein [Alkalidesulfovibrio alkalitolerans DSM 16529]